MPRPETKIDLQTLGEGNLKKLLELIASLSEETRSKSFDNSELNDRDRTIADVVCHLHEWHNMLSAWYRTGMEGKKPAIPAEGVTWQTLPVLNRQIYERYRGTSLPDAIGLLRKSHQAMMDLIDSHTDEELFTKKRYAWTGSTSLGAYLISATSSHYDWALKTIKPLKRLE